MAAPTWAMTVGVCEPAGRPRSVGSGAVWTWLMIANAVIARNMLTAMPPSRASVVAAFLLLGFWKAGTPLLIASTPVSAVQPEANDRRKRKASARPVKWSGLW